MFIPIILCGGAGSRLWPVSRQLHPKPFMHLQDGESLLQKAFLRATSLPVVKEILTVTNKELFYKTCEEYVQVNKTAHKTSFILEPFGRNTAAAIISAALCLQKKYGPEALMLVLPADHLIADVPAFQKAVEEACNLAKEGQLVTFGMQVKGPETGYGYLKFAGNQVLKFVEKPSFEKAQEYAASKEYLWNSGMFCFTVKTLLQEADSHCPHILAATETCLAQSKTQQRQGVDTLELEADSFFNVPEDSIDYALMEKSTKVSVVPCDLGWSDVGSWTAVAELIPPDAGGNRLSGDVLTHDVRDCYIQSSQRLIGALGIDNLMVIDTPDALLLADRSRVQEVKSLYNQLKAQNHDTHKLHQTVHRPWGTYTVLEEGPGFKIKRIVVNPKASLSLQQHQHRSEHWVVVNGSATVTNNESVLQINTNESTYIPAGNKHRLQNLTDEPVVLIEVQSGAYLGEDDIVRFEDTYGREKD